MKASSLTIFIFIALNGVTAKSATTAAYDLALREHSERAVQLISQTQTIINTLRGTVANQVNAANVDIAKLMKEVDLLFLHSKNAFRADVLNLVDKAMSGVFVVTDATDEILQSCLIQSEIFNVPKTSLADLEACANEQRKVAFNSVNTIIGQINEDGRIVNSFSKTLIKCGLNLGCQGQLFNSVVGAALPIPAGITAKVQAIASLLDELKISMKSCESSEMAAAATDIAAQVNLAIPCIKTATEDLLATTMNVRFG